MQTPANCRLKLAVLTPLLALAACNDGSGASSTASSLAAAPESGSVTAAACVACHTGGMSFSGGNPEEVARLIAAIAAGEKPHPPLNLPSTDSGSIQSLAEALTGN